MVKVEICKEGEAILAFRVEGHSGYAEKGQDIVCAAVSAVTQATIKGLLTYLENKPAYQADAEGLLACSLPDNLGAEDMLKSQVLLGTMEMELKDLAFAYQDFIAITTRRC